MVAYVKRTWDEVERYIDIILNQIKDKGINPSGVYGVPRGGLIPATIIAYRLNIPLLSAPVEDCLIIDDRSDTGSVFTHFFPNPHQAFRYYLGVLETSSSVIYSKMDFVGKILESDYKTVFPWETVSKVTHSWLFEDD